MVFRATYLGAPVVTDLLKTKKLRTIIEAMKLEYMKISML